MKTEKILVIGEMGDARTMIVAVLEGNGYLNILQADSGEEGIKMVGTHRPDLVVITGLKLSGMRGEQVVRWFFLNKSNFPGIRIIAMSGDHREVVEPVAMAAGAHAFLAKPCTPQELMGTVEALLAKT